MNKIISIIQETLISNNIDFKSIEYLAGDASNRKYFKILQKKVNNILMYDDLKEKSIENFILKTKQFNRLGIKVPKIFFSFSKQGILILENLGNLKYNNILTHENEKRLYKIAIDSLVHLHKTKIKIKSKIYSKHLFFEESKLFFDWYLKFKEKEFTSKQFKEFKDLLYEALDIPLLLPKVYIHRDFHVDNLFFLPSKNGIQKCGWIDYQDALFGPLAYDVVSILEDARREIGRELKEELLHYYLDRVEFEDKNLFKLAFSIIAVQRHLKVLGIFARLHIRDDKSEYLEHIPNIISMLKTNLEVKSLKGMKDLISNFL